jgi:hypothetical protein
MKKVLIIITSLTLWGSFVYGQVCTPSSTYNGSGTNAFSVVDPNGVNGGTITKSNGIQFNNVAGARECRGYVTGLAISDVGFTGECRVRLTAGDNPGHIPMAFTAGIADINVAASGCPNQTTNDNCTYTSTNQSAIQVYIYTPGVAGASDILTQGTSIVVFTKLGSNAIVQAGQPIPIPANAVGDFTIRFERYSATQGRLSYVNSTTNAVVASVCVAIPATIVGLNTLQSGVATGASSTRVLTGNMNNFRVYNACNVSVLPNPTVTPATICSGNSAAVSASTVTPTPIFSWFNAVSGGVSVATGSNYTTPALISTTTYFASYADFCGLSSSRIPVVVTVNPSPIVATITGNSMVCKNQIMALESTTPNGVWSSSNNAIATIKQTGVVTGISVGSVTISYKVISGSCSTTVSKVVTVNDVLSFQITGPTPVCPNTSGNPYTVTPVVAGADYTWNIQDAPGVGVNFPVNGSTNTTLTIPNSVANNQFTIRCQGLNACGASQIVSKLISVSSSVPVNPDVTCSGTNGTNTCVNLVVTNNGTNTVKWIVGGVVQSTATSFVRPLSTSVLCTYTSASGCTKSTWYSPAVVCTYSQRKANRDAVSEDYALKVYPNPNEGDFTFVTNGYVGKALVINVLGEIVEEIIVDETRSTYEILMTGKPKGTYLLKLTGDVEDHVNVFVVQ